MKSKLGINLSRTSRFTSALLATAAIGGTEIASAIDIKTPTGFLGAAYTRTDDGTESFLDGGISRDALKVGFAGSEGDFGGFVSVFYTPDNFSGGEEVGILDAFLTYKTGNLTFTGGKYLSWLGYEAFNLNKLQTITFATDAGAIPAFHSGLKVDYVTDTLSAGVNVSDSIRGGTGFWTGDEDYNDGLGYEAYVKYKGIDKLTIFGGIAYEDSEQQDFSTYDLWASYALTDKMTLAAEVVYNDNGPIVKQQGLLLLKYAFTPKFSTIARFGVDAYETGGDDKTRYTISPSYSFTDYLLVRAEVTMTATEAAAGDSVFSGLQAVLQF
jgi:Putative beta-barrel porin-2, OmpL-like. bbp2